MPKSTYYDRIKNDRKGKRNNSNAEDVRRMFFKHHGSFGRRILKKLLEIDGITISEDRISRIMKEQGLVSKYGRKKCKNVYTDKNINKKYIQDNLYVGLSADDKLKNIWSMDFTEQKINGKRIYTCGIISVNGKNIVGYKQSFKCTSKLAVETLKRAIEEHGVPYMIMTDRGSQFTSRDFFDIIEKYKILHSMSRPYNPIDNCFIETFWKTLKIEIGKTTLLTPETYAMVIDYYIYYYNYERPHSTLGYKPPCIV